MTTATTQPDETRTTAWEFKQDYDGRGIEQFELYFNGILVGIVFDEADAKELITAVNSIDSLREENRGLREAAGNLVSVAQKLPQPATVDGLALADALAAVRAALRLGEGRE